MALWRRITRASDGELTVQEAIYDVLRHSDIRLSEIANRTGIPYETLRSYTCEPDNPSGAHRCLPVYQVPPITNATHNFALLDTLEAATGRVAFEMPQIENPSKDLLLEIAGALRELGDLATVTGEALGDRQITTGELRRIEEEGYEVIQQVLRLMAVARACVGRAPKPDNRNGE